MALELQLSKDEMTQARNKMNYAMGKDQELKSAYEKGAQAAKDEAEQAKEQLRLQKEQIQEMLKSMSQEGGENTALQEQMKRFLEGHSAEPKQKQPRTEGVAAEAGAAGKEGGADQSA